MFWEKAKEFFNKDAGTAVDDRRHSIVIQVATAISVRDLEQKDLEQQVTECCPEKTPILSD